MVLRRPLLQRLRRGRPLAACGHEGERERETGRLEGWKGERGGAAIPSGQPAGPGGTPTNLWASDLLTFLSLALPLSAARGDRSILPWGWAGASLLSGADRSPWRSTLPARHPPAATRGAHVRQSERQRQGSVPASQGDRAGHTRAQGRRRRRRPRTRHGDGATTSPWRACSTRPASTCCSSATRSAWSCRACEHAPGDARRDLPTTVARRRAGRGAGARRRRHALHELPGLAPRRPSRAPASC